MQYQNIDLDLDDGKKCCFCCGLEVGYNILGIFGFINGIYNAINAISIISSGVIGFIILYGTLAGYGLLYGIVWLLSFIARRKGDSRSFKSYVNIFSWMNIVNVILSIIVAAIILILVASNVPEAITYYLV